MGKKKFSKKKPSVFKTIFLTTFIVLSLTAIAIVITMAIVKPDAFTATYTSLRAMI